MGIKKSIDFINNYYTNYPLKSILFLALFARIIAALFSHGYGFSDDHFLVIEVAQQWVDGVNEKLWMPWNGNTVPSGHSLFYPGLHYILFLICKAIGLSSPVIKMYIVRLLHAGYSLSIVYYGYKITEKLSGEKVAKQVGLLLAIFWFMPMLSVRNMVEMVCIPPLIFSTWLLIKSDNDKNIYRFLVAGLVAGIAFSFRFQTMIFIGGIGLAIWMQKKWLQGIWFGIGAIISIVIIQGSIDLYIWGRPFAEFSEYVRYNIENAENYGKGPWYNYLLLISGLMIPPVSLFILFGLFKSRKHYLLIILPALCFLIFHSIFPNKQERFILPVIPFFLMAGMAGWHSFEKQSVFWLNRKKLLKGCWTFFWVLNTILLVLMTPSSTKVSRVDAMTYLSTKKDMNQYMIESSNSWGAVMMPLFYAGKWDLPYEVCGAIPAKVYFDTIQYYHKPWPDYIVFAEAENLDARVDTIKRYVKGLTFEKKIDPSLLDKTMHFLNPVNVNQTYYIYKVEK